MLVGRCIICNHNMIHYSTILENYFCTQDFDSVGGWRCPPYRKLRQNQAINVVDVLFDLFWCKLRRWSCKWKHSARQTKTLIKPASFYLDPTSRRLKHKTTTQKWIPTPPNIAKQGQALAYLPFSWIPEVSGNHWQIMKKTLWLQVIQHTNQRCWSG